jgi:XTP/dITP diphosphohydrolase
MAIYNTDVPSLHGKRLSASPKPGAVDANDHDNMALLLEKLKGIPTTQWQAYFYCAIVLVQHPFDPTPVIACGRLDGHIVDTPQGNHGFGYDPVFYLPSHQCTLAQLPLAIKNTLSHRACALKQLQQQLSAI